MKRFVVLLAIVSLVVALPLSHAVLAKGKAPAKVKLCHVTNGTHEDGKTGIVIEVSAAALKAHCGHGDRRLIATSTKEVGDSCNPDWDNGSVPDCLTGE